MKKDLETIEMETPETLLEIREENMEDILASIRKIMAPSSQLSPDQKKEKDDIVSQSEASFQEESPSQKFEKNGTDVLILTKKATSTGNGEVMRTSSAEKKNETIPPVLHKQERKNSLEDLVVSSLSPLIESWLEKNLPHVVEKVVKDEIKKLIRF